jgi:hypothetical protein
MKNSQMAYDVKTCSPSVDYQEIDFRYSGLCRCQISRYTDVIQLLTRWKVIGIQCIQYSVFG